MINLPNYEIGKLAGRGGIAEVYLARHKLLDRTVAIKLISPTHADDLADKRFLKEAKVMAGLRHPNIVSIYDVGVYENKYYIIMEYLEGGDLKQSIKRGLTIPRTLEILRQIASALAHAHDKGFIHRDIKSQNIMFRGDGTAVLTDFGIVKDLTADSGYTLDGTSIGTPHYMSPEQAQGAGEIDWRTDLYSLGVTFYEMLTGDVPYNADSAIAVALKHIKDPVPRLPEEFSGFQPIIDKLMAKKPDDRFQSVHDLLKAIARIDGKSMPANTLVMDHSPLSKIRFANIFTGVLIGCLLVGLVVLGQPYLSGLIDRRKMPDDSASIKNVPSVNAPSADVTAKEPAKAFWDGIKPDTFKKSSSPFLDTEQLTGLIVRKDHAKALDTISRIRKQMPDKDNDMMQKADQFLESGQHADAGDIFNTVLSVDPQNPSAILGLLYVAIEKQQSVTAAKNPSVTEYTALMALLDKGIKNINAPYFKQMKINAVESVYDHARRRMEQQNLKSAAIWAETGLKNAPDHLRLKKLELLIQAEIRVSENRLTLPDQDNALAYYRKVLLLDPDDPASQKGIADIAGYYKTRALAAQKEHDYTQAAQLIEKACTIMSDDPDLQHTQWLILGDMYAARGQFTVPENENARYFYQKILEQSPQNAQAIGRIADIELQIPLYRIQQADGISEKISAYSDLFSKLETAAAEKGEAHVANIKKQVIRQIKADLQTRKNLKKPIPAEFMTLVSGQFPNENEIFNTQYKIFIAMGDEAASKTQKADYYLKALKFNPALVPAKKKIQNIANELDNSGQTNDAKAVLKQAIEVAPGHAPFNDMYQAVKKVQDTKAELFTLLLKIKRLSSLAEKTELYTTLFSKLDSATKTFGENKITAVKKDVIAQVKSDINGRKDSRLPISAEFMSVVENGFSELNAYAVTAQYEILIETGDRTQGLPEKSDFYLNALKLDNHREEAKQKIERIAKTLEERGNNADAVAVLEQAMTISPNDLIFSELFDKIKRSVEIYAINSGCGKENMISAAPDSIENLSFCIEYRNLVPDSVVTVTVSQKDVQTMEIPVVLEGRSGSKPVYMVAPIEGFVPGEHTITVRQNETRLSENMIQITPKRR